MHTAMQRARGDVKGLTNTVRQLKAKEKAALKVVEKAEAAAAVLRQEHRTALDDLSQAENRLQNLRLEALSVS